ncbi:hypothetical protein C1708_05930 [Streptomyces sp. DH-12]|uniref:outer membrane protein assembly factor BamB family protein n=1 Tax=Streptomyces sp. DH-12 TaxID=2072509 RepID=UPI000CCEE008|nr:PQQ-binding-like beta-propeller repeat protein [Streptomyces sp. DH-12]PNV31908.1 hypothetical protein C1708_05930 [Streptomyces sp. DH-12]
MPQHRALLIGASNYDMRGIHSLPFIPGDLARLGSALRRRGFKDVQVLSQLEGGKQLGANFIKGCVAGFLRRAGRGDTLVIVLSGHGVHAAGRDYLVPEDIHEDTHPFESGCVPIDWGRDLDETPADHVVFLIDACREGIEVASMSVAGVTQWGRQKTDAALRRKVAYVYGCSPAQLSLYVRDHEAVTDGVQCGTVPGESFSIFSRAISDVVTSHQGALALDVFREAVQERVSLLHQAYRKRGNPQLLRTITDIPHNAFTFLPAAAGRHEAATPPVTEYPATPSRSTSPWWSTPASPPSGLRPQPALTRTAEEDRLIPPAPSHSAAPGRGQAAGPVGLPPRLRGSSPGPRHLISRRRVLLGLAGTVLTGVGFTAWKVIDASTPDRQLWKFNTREFVQSSPAVAGGVVYVGSGDGKLYAVDAATGEEHWSFATGEWDASSPSDSAVKSSPAVADGVVYVGSQNKKLYAVDAATGKKRWSFATGGEVYSSPAVAGGVVYVGSRDEKLYAVDAATGDERWSFATGDRVDSSPTVTKGVVYVGSSNDKLYAVDAATGDERWSFATDFHVESSPTVADGVVYIGSYDAHLYAVKT